MKTNTRTLFGSENTLRALALVATMMTILATAAIAQPGQRGQRPEGDRGAGGRGGDPMARIVEFLELTPDQEEQWKAAHQEHRLAVEPIFEQMKDNQEALRAALDVEQPEPLEVGQLVIASKGLREEIGQSKEVLDSALESILDAEQLTKWQAFQEARGGRERGPRGPRGSRDDSGQGFPGGRG